MVYTEEQLKKYAKPLSKTEEEKCENAINIIVDALKDIGLNRQTPDKIKYSEKPSLETEIGNDKYTIKIFLQGSYANNTNVRQSSDVDIAIVRTDRFRPKFRNGVQKCYYDFINANPEDKNFKDIIQEILNKKFQKDTERKNKSIKINGNSNRKDADVVPALSYRDYSNDYNFDKQNYTSGILIQADDGTEIINYPKQHFENGVNKNEETNHYFKKMVRIAKEIRFQMEEQGCYTASKISSFDIECLIYNIPNVYFQSKKEYLYMFEDIVNFLYHNIDNVKNFMEVNNIKPMCHNSTNKENILKIFIKELKEFYNYE